MRRIAPGLAALAFLLLGGTARATVPTGFTQTLVTSGLSSPTAMAFAPDGRIFVTQQGGALRVIESGTLLAAPFVSLTVDSAGERGLLGIAFDPGFASNHFVYVYYTVPGTPPHNRVSRFTASGNTAVAGSEVPILDLDNLSTATNHNGGAIHFGPDGKLYVAVGENANSANSQTFGNRLGKILRINADGSIPSDNPYFLDPSVVGANKSIWARGLRNPFTFAFQNGTGRLFVNDVGETTWEEINDGIAGSNYGWPTCEGLCSPPNASLRDPLYEYNHTTGSPTGCAIVGGAFYNPATVTFPASYVGKYFFADLCSGFVRTFDPAAGTSTAFGSGFLNPVDLAVPDDGSLYVLMRGTMSTPAALYRIAPTPTALFAAGFAAERHGSHVLLRWRSAGNPRVLGFFVSRGRLKLNRSPVCCSLVDRRPGRAPRYRLEAVLVDGSRVLVATATPLPSGARPS